MRQLVIIVTLILATTLVVYFGLDAIGLLPVSASLQAESIDWLFNIEIAAISFLFALIIVPLVYSVIVFRRKAGDDSDGEHIEGNTRLELIWTIIPLMVVIALAYIGAYSLGDTLRVDPQAMVVNVNAFQWAWTFEYPEYGIKTTELYLPVDEQVLLQMESPDVIHSFWVPEFRVKQDIVPGRVTELRITPSKTGNYSVRCSELCGTSHAYMLAPVVVVSQQEFEAWVADQQAQMANITGPDAGRGESLAQQYGCMACHSIDGSIIVGPSWRGLFQSEVNLADGTTVTADEAFITESILQPNAKIVAGFPANAMPQYSLTDQEVADLLAFIETLK